ncbi:probable DEAD-box ATP-dependent RNA helicase 48 [Salvia miltiorrhiza]|uniref:probable DEAD-box ATP-dependent RNA helicase 48 n=1 Tax=Salvia miltiorrhiza TaxID=226208 RepID=UPI0025AD249D|nr:probable DEAD-box ATP-dependent RNA helicase 48 [Salvia miltiorrhiza]
MHFASIFLHTHSKSLRHRLTFLRRMGGGPRTFPGGINKWQWKRLHEKKAREKEKRLLEQEKQLYQARVRSEIRAKVAAAENPGFAPEKPRQNQPNYGPMTPEEHIKALADRFMKEGAEDLWNENDGPLTVPVNKTGKSRFLGDPINLQKLIAERSISNGGEKIQKSHLFGNISVGVAKPRRFSTYARWGDNLMGGIGNEYFGKMNNGLNLMGNPKLGGLIGVSNLLNSNCYYSVDAARAKSKRLNFVRNSEKSVVKDGLDPKRSKWPRFRGRGVNSDDDDSDDYDDDDVDMGSAKKVLSSSAALGKYDMKRTKRVQLEQLEGEIDLSQEVEKIREEIRQRNSMQHEGKDEEESLLSTKRFDECDVSPLTVKALTEAGYVQMTTVQEATLSACLEGKDALVKARAGTGKSIAFLLPAIETVLKASSKSTNQRVPPIYVLIICPARELASQIAAEANVLLKHHSGIGVLTLVGGTRFKDDQRRLESDPCHILVATPGRLLDHIENKSAISVRLMGLQMLVLDEADRLLDLGFRKDMEKIVDCLPRKKQSLLFSATVPKEVRRISQLVLKREHAYINTLGLESVETNAKVKQFYHVAHHDQHIQIVHHLLKSHISQVPEYKVIVFCATAMMTSLMFSLLREMKLNARELHSRKPPLYRARVSEEFKEAKQAILVTSDVSARGLNYPDVTLVIQVGIPPDRGQYIHRLGRTGRQGKDGEGCLLLAPWEQYFLDDIKDLPLEKLPSPELDPDVMQKIQEKMDRIDTSIKEAAYHAWLGYYNSINAIGRDKTTLVELANQFAASIGLQKPPALFRKTAVKMGLKGIPGIQLRN